MTVQNEEHVEPPAPSTEEDTLKVAPPQTVSRQRRYAVHTESGWVEMADEGRVKIPTSALVGTAIGVLAVYFMLRYWSLHMDGLIVPITNFGRSVAPMVVLMLLSGVGSLLMHRASRQPGAHESRGLITWGLLLNWLPLVLFGLALFGTLMAAMGISDGVSHETTLIDLGGGD